MEQLSSDKPDQLCMARFEVDQRAVEEAAWKASKIPAGQGGRHPYPGKPAVLAASMTTTLTWLAGMVRPVEGRSVLVRAACAVPGSSSSESSTKSLLPTN